MTKATLPPAAAAALIGELLDLYEREQRFAAVREAYTTPSDGVTGRMITSSGTFARYPPLSETGRTTSSSRAPTSACSGRAWR